MSDTLRERLARLKVMLPTALDDRVVDDAIAELDRLEAEVKKPRLPPGYTVMARYADHVELWENEFLKRTIGNRDDLTMYSLFSAFLPASPSDQGQSYQTPMNTETAEKPKPVSLKEAFARGNHMCCDFDDWANHYPEMFITRRELAILVSTLDQARGV